EPRRWMPDSGGGAGGGGGAVLYFQGSLKTNTSVLEERGNWDQRGRPHRLRAPSWPRSLTCAEPFKGPGASGEAAAGDGANTPVRAHLDWAVTAPILEQRQRAPALFRRGGHTAGSHLSPPRELVTFTSAFLGRDVPCLLTSPSAPRRGPAHPKVHRTGSSSATTARGRAEEIQRPRAPGKLGLQARLWTPQLTETTHRTMLLLPGPPEAVGVRLRAWDRLFAPHSIFPSAFPPGRCFLSSRLEGRQAGDKGGAGWEFRAPLGGWLNSPSRWRGSGRGPDRHAVPLQAMATPAKHVSPYVQQGPTCVPPTAGLPFLGHRPLSPTPRGHVCAGSAPGTARGRARPPTLQRQRVAASAGAGPA
ncbi:hypothetical protein EI555_019052, partial [Monodon monoceros]